MIKTRFKKMVLIPSLIFILCSQVAFSQKLVELESRFDLKAVEWVKTPGNTTVKGKAFITLETGDIKGCSGFGIELLPVAKYSNERIKKTYGNNDYGQILLTENPPKFTPDAKGYHEMVLKAQCNNNNEFVFNHVNPGDYYVMAFIIWNDENTTSESKLGGAVMKRVVVKKDVQLNVIL